MSDAAKVLDDIRSKILADPDVILEDRDVMKALVAANERQMGNNIVDLRGIAMERLEQRFDRLEDTHRNVIAAAYENLAGTNQVQRAVLTLLEPYDFNEFLLTLGREVTDILKVDKIKLCLESPNAQAQQSAATKGEIGSVVSFMSQGSIEEYLVDGRNIASRVVTLRTAPHASNIFYGPGATGIKSEALLKLDLGAGNLPGLLAMGSFDADQFQPNQGSDLLAYFGGAFERIMRRWLS